MSNIKCHRYQQLKKKGMNKINVHMTGYILKRITPTEIIIILKVDYRYYLINTTINFLHHKQMIALGNYKSQPSILKLTLCIPYLFQTYVLSNRPSQDLNKQIEQFFFSEPLRIDKE